MSETKREEVLLEYGELLNEHQRQIYEDFVLNDLSLGEIAAEEGISRQGVHDLVKRCSKKLQDYENKLHLVEKFLNIKEDVGQIHELAKQNTPKLLPAVFKPMRIVIEELLGNPCNNLIQSDDIMFVLTNSLRSFGAICFLYEDVLFHIGNLLRENYFILPSSIHEVIIIPESQAPCKETLNEMIVEINESQVEIEDVLSDHVYYYNREKKELL